ncbi:MAG: restriction endonuclease subunit S [Prosthecobacter sp.]|uniref:restriction endonuclease subunit S n=1 Tax=Prosthecobacter sp. TaxID=1965333 RepID=UPI0019E221EA|nr:restriction endonuclease subunit S [Prosthecobacter sp.]MBE2281980.1 restriction endonuclease subunit S [Prosthecobacter sp.]
MIEGLKPYAEYKESDIPWVRSLPAHWVTKRGKSYLVTIDQRSKSGKEELLTVSSARGVVPRNSAKVTMFKAESYAGHKLCWPGDLVINSLWAWGGGLGVTQHHGIISTAYSVYRPRPSAQMNPRFLHELVRSSPFHWELQVRSKGVWISRLQLTDASFLDAPIPLPPPDEQAAIVRFLDHANWKIDGFIRTKRKLIRLLNEQKQAIIHHAVTRGLDPDVSLKPSGIPWLGDIPAHWEVMQLRQVLSFGPKNGVSPQASTGIGVLSFSISAVRDGCVNLAGHEKFVELDSARVAGFRIYKGDILLVRGNGNVALVGKCGLVEDCPENCVYPDILMKLRPNEKMNAEFMVLAINSSYVTNQVSTLAKTSNGAFKVSGATVRSISMVVPPYVEQMSLIEAIRAEATTVNTAIIRTEREIALMQEYRTRLTADIVTGKLDVREAAAKLPDLPTDPAAELFTGASPEHADILDEIEPEES